ncbi:MAG: ABC-2 transporter permease [Anaerolineaceae bacterium]
MKALLYKEIKLALHPTTYLFMAIGAMLMIPSYPYYVAFVYTCLGIFFIFLSGRENKDILFTASLPVQKSDVVKSRVFTVAIIELLQLAIGVPFAIIGMRINPNPAGNMAGIEANMAFFGLVLIMYALFNAIYLPMYYRTAVKVGGPLVFASIAVTIYVVAAELAVQMIPFLKTRLDTADPAMAVYQLPILIAGLLIFGLGLWLTYRKSASNFEKVDL